MFYKMLRIIIAVGVLVAGVQTIVFAAHTINHNSVDGRGIQWASYTAYTDARDRANSQWNALGKISITQDTIWTIADVDWKDTSDCSATWDGRYTNGLITDLIQLNSCKLKDYSSDKRRMVAVHEMGHAHGLGDHNSGDGVSANDTVMWSCSTCSGKTAPTAHDKKDYDALWP